MRTPEQVQEIVRLLLEEYPEASCTLDWGKDYELLFSVRLAAQCTDERVNRITPALFARFPTLEHSCVCLFSTPWTVPCQAPLSMGSLQSRILEWIAMPSSRGSSQPRDRTQVSHSKIGEIIATLQSSNKN